MKPLRVPPIITLTTDFGLADHYVGTMKGVLLSGCPDARIVDISHEIPAFSTYAGAYAIARAVPFFPPGTVHVLVVDPGVGTARKPLLVEADKQYLIAPDNGVLSLFLQHHGNATIWEITNRSLWRNPASATFHGRDVFAPVAAALASGSARPEDVGPELDQITLLPDLQPVESEPGLWHGRVLSVDHFGNVITNFAGFDFPEVVRGEFTLCAAKKQITDFRPTFGDAAEGLCFAYIGSSDYIEIGINQRSAAAYLGISPGEAVTLRVTID